MADTEGLFKIIDRKRHLTNLNDGKDYPVVDVRDSFAALTAAESLSPEDLALDRKFEEKRQLRGPVDSELIPGGVGFGTMYTDNCKDIFYTGDSNFFRYYLPTENRRKHKRNSLSYGNEPRGKVRGSVDLVS